MAQLTFPNVEAEVVASILKEQQNYLKEALDALEKRDISPSEMRAFLSFVDDSLRKLKRHLKKVSLHGD